MNIYICSDPRGEIALSEESELEQVFPQKRRKAIVQAIFSSVLQGRHDWQGMLHDLQLPV